MKNARMIIIPDEIAKQPPAFRFGWVDWYSGKPISQVPMGMSVRDETLWQKGWNAAHDYDSGKPLTLDEVKVQTPFMMHLKTQDEYETRAMDIFKKLEDAGVIENNCPHQMHFSGFSDHWLYAGFIVINAETSWGGDTHRLDTRIPIDWMDGPFPTEAIDKFIKIALDTRAREKAKAAEDQATLEREQKLAQLRALKAEFPDA